MAIGAKRISPLEKQARVAIGVRVPFSSAAVFTSTYTTQEAIKSNLINFFLTNTNERPLNPTFGGNLRNYLFNQITNLTIPEIEANIQEQLNTYFPSVLVDTLDIITNPNQNTLAITLTYSILNTGISDTLEVTFL